MFYFSDNTYLDNYVYRKLDNITDWEYQGLKDLFNDQELVHKARVFDGNAPDEQLSKIRRSEVIWIHPDMAREKGIYPTITKIFDVALQMNNQYFQFDLTHCQPLQLTRYDYSNQGFYEEHTDVEFSTWRDCRKLSFVIQLSHPDEYEGGEFVFKGTEVTEEYPHLVERGTMISFPSYSQHGVKPVTKGTRYSLVGWAMGPKFR